MRRSLAGSAPLLILALVLAPALGRAQTRPAGPPLFAPTEPPKPASIQPPGQANPLQPPAGVRNPFAPPSTGQAPADSIAAPAVNGNGAAVQTNQTIDQQMSGMDAGRARQAAPPRNPDGVDTATPRVPLPEAPFRYKCWDSDTKAADQRAPGFRVLTFAGKFQPPYKIEVGDMLETTIQLPSGAEITAHSLSDEVNFKAVDANDAPGMPTDRVIIKANGGGHTATLTVFAKDKNTGSDEEFVFIAMSSNHECRVTPDSRILLVQEGDPTGGPAPSPEAALSLPGGQSAPAKPTTGRPGAPIRLKPEAHMQSDLDADSDPLTAQLGPPAIPDASEGAPIPMDIAIPSDHRNAELFKPDYAYRTTKRGYIDLRSKRAAGALPNSVAVMMVMPDGSLRTTMRSDISGGVIVVEPSWPQYMLVVGRDYLCIEDKPGATPPAARVSSK